MPQNIDERKEDHSVSPKEKQEASCGQVQGTRGFRNTIRNGLKGKSFDEQKKMLKPNMADMGKTKSTTSDAGGPIPYKEEMEQKFNVDFSSVRAFKGKSAKIATQALGAEAFTCGKEVAFRDESPSKKIVAHELTHVIQQEQMGETLQLKPENEGIANKTVDPYEEQANQVEESMTNETTRSPLNEEGEKLRQAVVNAVYEWLHTKKDIISAKQMKSMREGEFELKVWGDDNTVYSQVVQIRAGIPNFTTCVQFAGSVLSDAAKKVKQGDLKSQKAIGGMIGHVMKLYGEEISFRNQISSFTETLRLIDESIDKMVAKRLQTEARKKLSEMDSNIETSTQNQITKQMDAAIKQIDKALEKLRKEQKKFQQKVDSLKNKLVTNRQENGALIRPEAPLTVRPEIGDFIWLCQPPNKKDYGVSEASKVPLSPGAFLHIAILVEKPERIGEDVELWRTVDGGGEKAKMSSYYVRTGDLTVYFENPIDKKYVTPSFMLGGWINTSSLPESAKIQGGK